jgi:hypothetical protein
VVCRLYLSGCRCRRTCIPWLYSVACREYLSAVPVCGAGCACCSPAGIRIVTPCMIGTTRSIQQGCTASGKQRARDRCPHSSLCTRAEHSGQHACPRVRDIVRVTRVRDNACVVRAGTRTGARACSGCGRLPSHKQNNFAFCPGSRHRCCHQVPGFSSHLALNTPLMALVASRFWKRK